MNSDPQSAEALFRRALEFKPDERTAFLAGACGGDVDLRTRVEALLAAHEAETGLLTVSTSSDSDAPNLEEAVLTEGPGSVISRYKLLEKLGEGGFGAVWAAEQKEPVRRRIALKIIKLGMDTRQVVARFEAERQALALMDHPNIAKVLDAGATDTGRPFFVMELVRGIPITEYCADKKLGTKERLDLFIKVCQAIQHAHQKGIIHRDIKPSNIMVTLHDGIPVPKVIDFGIAKATQQELTEKTVYTKFNQFIGTPAYMSPEQAEMSGLDIDTRSDIYSLGVLLYELLTGSTPFDTEELMRSGLDEMRKIIREREPERPSTKLSQTLETSGDIRLWDADTGEAVGTLAGHGSWISWLEFSEDGRVLASASADQTARLWDVDTRTVQTVLRGHRDELYALSLSPDGNTLATGSKDGTLFIWSTRPEQRRKPYLSRAVSSEDFHVSPDGKHLFVHANEGVTLELDPTDLSEVGPVDEFAGHSDLMFSPDSRSAIVIREDEGTYVYDVASKRPERFLEGVIVRELAAGAGYAAARAATTNEVTWYDVRTWERLGTMPLPSEERIIQSELSYDGQYFAYEQGRSVGEISIVAYNVLDGTAVPVTHFNAHRREVNGMAFSPDGALFATTSATGFGYLWNTRGWTRAATLRGHALGIHDVAFSPDSRRVITGGSSDDAVKIWDTASHQEVMTLPVEGSVFTNPILLEDNRTLMAGSWDNDKPRLHVWRAPTWEEIAVEEDRRKRGGEHE